MNKTTSGTTESGAVISHLRPWIRIALGAIIAIYVFLRYNEARTMQETLGVDGDVLVSSSLVAAWFLLEAMVVLFMTMGAVLIGFCNWCHTSGVLSDLLHELRGRRVIAAVLFLWLLSCAAGELWILRDEVQFRDEVAQHVAKDESGVYGRSRAWPNRLASLVYAPDRGIHATD